ncbi:nineteen complex-related protein 2-domain-containing protein [Xylariaceae sp. FL0594]|nr:nineteen complex-related protein 2-domain-containing protein [Xylariaceae sp. FL0594]
MSSFGAKRKARKIAVQDDDEETPSPELLNPPPEPQEPALQPTFKSRKPAKQSSLRKSININDEPPGTETKEANGPEAAQDEGPSRPTVVRPKSKKRQSSSRLSFGPSEMAAGDDDAMVLGDEVFTPKKSSLAATATENSAYRKAVAKNLPLNRLPMRSMEDDDDRPRYSKEYLSELQSATPNTPQDMSKLRIEEDEMSLDPSELEGAMVVDLPSNELTRLPVTGAATSILTEAEIREKKERRARLAKERGSRGDTEDFISLSDHEDEGDRRGRGDSYLTLLSRRDGGIISSSSSKHDTRLVREDEDLGEGFDEFVEDGGLSLGKKAERAARRKQRAEMASLISAAEGGGGDDEAGGIGINDSDDSEAERLAAFEAAQTRKGMDGLAEERERQRRKLAAVPVPPKITPLPDLSVLAEEFRARMRMKEANLERMRKHVADLKAEREDILKREPEVQKLLNEAGERYRALMMPGNAANTEADTSGNGNGNGNGNGDGVTAARTLLDQFREGPGTPGERGLESLGTTPIRQAQTEMEL